MDLATIYLRFASEAASFSVAEALGAVVQTEDGPRLARYTHRYGLDVVGQVVLPGTYDDEGVELTPPTPLPGWHVNLRILDGSELPDELAPYVIYPEVPIRVFF